MADEEERRTTQAVFDSARVAIDEADKEGKLRIPTSIAIVWLDKDVAAYSAITTTDNDQDKYELALALEEIVASLRRKISEGFIPTEPPIVAERIETEEL